MGRVVNIVVINVISECDIEEALDIASLPFHISFYSILYPETDFHGLYLALRLPVRFYKWEIMV